MVDDRGGEARAVSASVSVADRPLRAPSPTAKPRLPARKIYFGDCAPPFR